MYRLSDGHVVHSVEEVSPYSHQGIFSYIAWSPDGSNLAVGRPNTGVWVWNVDDWKLLTKQDSISEFPYEVPGFAWSPDGMRLALGIGHGEVMIWDKIQNQWNTHTDYPGDQISITWTPNQQILILSQQPEQGLYYLETGEMASKLDVGIDGASGYAIWSPDGKYAFLFFDLGGGIINVEENRYEGFGSCCYPEVAWSMDSRYFAATSYGSNEIRVWDAMEEQIIREEKQGEIIYTFAWTPENELLAVGLLNGQQVVWNTNTGEVLFSINK